MDERKITIIEGPPPTFEVAMDEWALGLVEGPSLSRIAVTQVRALNGPALVERCYRAWRQQEPIHLEFRTPEGLIQRLPIVAAHYSQIDDADVLRLWVAANDPDVLVEYEFVDEMPGDESEVEADLLGTINFDDIQQDPEADDEEDDDDLFANLGF